MRIIDPATGQLRKAKIARPWPRVEQQQRPNRAARWLAKHDRGRRGLSLKELLKEWQRKRKQNAASRKLIARS